MGIKSIFFTAAVLFACSPQDPTAQPSSSPPVSPQDQLQCSPIKTQGLSIDSFQPSTDEGRLYAQVVRLIRGTLEQETKQLSINGKQAAQPPGELGKLLGNRQLNAQERQQHNQMRAEFNKKIKKITARYQYYQGNRPLIFQALPTALIEKKSPDKQRDIARDIAVIATLWQQKSAPQGRAVYSTNDSPWPEGKVVYYFDPRDDSKIAVPLLAELRAQARWAAQHWQEETDGVVSFVENSLPPLSSSVSDFLYGPRYRLIISFVKMGFGGLATVGYHPFKDRPYTSNGHGGPYNNMTLNVNTLTDSKGDMLTGEELKRGRDHVRHHALHEFGHVLGLRHEHERPERDRYLSNITGDLIATKPRELVDSWTLMRQGPFRVSLPYQRSCSDAQTLTGSDYDYFSVMHYPRGKATKTQSEVLRLKRDNGTVEEKTIAVEPGDRMVKLRAYVGQYAFLSPQDVATIKGMYKGNF